MRKINRALLELDTGIAALGLLCQLVGMWFVTDKPAYTAALWIGVLLALGTSIHMYRTLDRALDAGEKASKMVMTAGILRYVFILIVFVVMAYGTSLNPLIAFLGIMTLKVAAYMQPFTHKFYNRLFHETDPVPQAMSEEESENEE